MPALNNDVVAIILARGGSKGLVRKNILPLNGIPLIAHTIKDAINIKAELPKALMYILDEKENYDIIDNNVDKVQQHIKERI